MISKANPPASSIIISVYNDVSALNLILQSLLKQTVQNFEIIISEDAEHPEMLTCTGEWKQRFTNIHHLQQRDDGFRKNIALNRAIMQAQTEHLIFIDGDCIAHPDFIKNHQRYSRRGVVSAGRRVELGERFSAALRNGSKQLSELTRPLNYLKNAYTLKHDGIRHYGLGFASMMLQRFSLHRPTRILGCNFSCHKQDLIDINGFNEDFLSAGWGEDSDIEWRLRHTGVSVLNVKFSAIQYHLYHKRWYTLDDSNRKILDDTRKANTYYCINGINRTGKAPSI